MSVTPEAIFESAVVLAGGDEEVDWRNACSRAYYAAYHRCRAIANEIEPYTQHAPSRCRHSHQSRQRAGTYEHGL